MRMSLILIVEDNEKNLKLVRDVPQHGALAGSGRSGEHDDSAPGTHGVHDHGRGVLDRPVQVEGVVVRGRCENVRRQRLKGRSHPITHFPPQGAPKRPVQ